MGAPFAWSQPNSEPISPEARSILDDRSYLQVPSMETRANVRTDTIATLGPLPDTMSLELYRNDINNKSVNLQSVLPPPGSSVVYQQAQYSGALDPANSPYFAAELQFPLGPGDDKAYRAEVAAEEQQTS